MNKITSNFSNARPAQQIVADISRVDNQIAMMQKKRQQLVSELNSVSRAINELAKAISE